MLKFVYWTITLFLFIFVLIMYFQNTIFNTCRIIVPWAEWKIHMATFIFILTVSSFLIWIFLLLTIQWFMKSKNDFDDSLDE